MAPANESVGNNMTAPVLREAPSPLDALFSHGLCQFVGAANTTTTPLSCLPWTYYGATIALVVLPILCGVVPCWLYSNRDLFKPTVHCSFSRVRVLAVFLLSLVSLGINFFEPYFGNDEKLNHGWYGSGSSHKKLTADLWLNLVLFLLLLAKPIKDRHAKSETSVLINYQRFMEASKHVSHREAFMSRILQDWEFVANVANLPLLLCEIVCVMFMECPGPFLYWKLTTTSLQFLRLFCLTMFCNEIIRIFRKMPISVGTVLRRIVWIVCYFLSFSAWIQLVETLGDPWLATYNGQKDMTYLKTVTFLYGKLVFLDVTQTQLDTTVAKISVYVAQAVALIFLVQIIPDMLKQLPAALRIRSFGSVYRQKDVPYILLLGSVHPNAVERFAENFRSTQRKENIVVLLEPTTPDSVTEEMHTVAGKHKDIFTVISGSVFTKDDLKNTMSGNCQCAFFFANESAPSFADEDHCNFLRVHTLKQHYPKTRVIVKVLLFENKERFYHIPNWFKKDKIETPDDGKPILYKADRAVCTGEIQFAMLAQRYFASGISTLVTSWFTPSNCQTVKSLSFEGVRHEVPNSDHYSDTMRERNHTSLGEMEEGRPLVLRDQNNNTPAPMSYKEARDGFGSSAVLFAVLQDGEFHLHPRENLLLQPGARLFFITALSTDKLEEKAEQLYIDTNKEQILATLPIKSKELKLPTMIQSVEQGDVVCDVTGQYWRHLVLPQTDIPIKLPSEIEKRERQHEREQHVVVCVVSDRNPSPIGLINLIRPLRAVHIQPPRVVILAESDFLNVEYPLLFDLPDVHFVKGNPLNDSHLDAINIQGCRMCIVVDASERPKEQSVLWQQRREQPQLSGVDLLPILPSHFFRHINAVLATVSVDKFLDRIRRIHNPPFLPEEILTCLHHEAVELISWDQGDKKKHGKPTVSADFTSPGFIDALMLQCYEDKDIFDAVRMLLVNGYRDISRVANNHTFRGCAYIGNQGKLTRMTFVKDGSRKGFRYSPAVRSAAVPNQAANTADIDVLLDDGRTNNFEELYRQAADRGLLIIGTQPAMPTDASTSPRLSGPYEYFVLERPFYVQARQIFFSQIEASLRGCSSLERLRILCALEFLPAFLLKAVEEGSNGLPTIFKPYNRERANYSKWFLVYYRIIAELVAHNSDVNERYKVVDRHIYRLLKGPLTSYANLNLPRLPEAILTYILHIYHREYLRIPFAIAETVLFHRESDVNDAAVARKNLQWSHLSGGHLNWKRLTFGDGAQL